MASSAPCVRSVSKPGRQCKRQNSQPSNPVAWARTPRRLDSFAGWTPPEVKLWSALNAACQTRYRDGRISVPELARYSGYSERSIYRILRKLKNRGAVYALITPGETAVYYLPFEYCPRRPTLTPANSVTAPNKEKGKDNYKGPPRTGRRHGPQSVRDDSTPVEYYHQSFSYEHYSKTCPNPLPFDEWNPNDWRQP